MRRTSTHRFTSALALTVLAGAAAADDLFVGGLSSLIYRGDPSTGSFDLVGACGGAVHSMVANGDDLIIGDLGGRVYRYDHAGDFITYLQDVENDATALVVHGDDFLSAGSDGTIRRYAKDGSDLTASEVLQAPISVSSMLMIGDVLFVGSSAGFVFRTDLSSGGGQFDFFGSCGNPVHSLAQNGAELLLGSSSGDVYRFDLVEELLVGEFQAGNDATSLVMHAGDLLSGGSDGTLRRLDPTDGTLIGSPLVFQQDVQALAFAGQGEPGTGYCYGQGCPCGNDDPTAGCVNAGGEGAKLTASGSASVATDDLVLSLTQIPDGQWGRFYMGAGMIEVSFGNGLLCAGSGGYGQFRFGVVNSGPGGFMAVGPGVVATSQTFPSGGQIFPGQTWNFQVWYRDVAGPCGSSFNTSNAYSVTFQP